MISCNSYSSKTFLIRLANMKTSSKPITIYSNTAS